MSWRYRKAFNCLQSWLTDCSWIHLILLIKLIQYKIEKHDCCHCNYKCVLHLLLIGTFLEPKVRLIVTRYMENVCLNYEINFHVHFCNISKCSTVFNNRVWFGIFWITWLWSQGTTRNSKQWRYVSHFWIHFSGISETLIALFLKCSHVFINFTLKDDVKCKGINTPSVKRQASSGSGKVSLECIVTLTLTLQIGPRPIPKRHHWPNVLNLTLDAPLDARCVYTLTGGTTRCGFVYVILLTSYPCLLTSWSCHDVPVGKPYMSLNNKEVW